MTPSRPGARSPRWRHRLLLCFAIVAAVAPLHAQHSATLPPTSLDRQQLARVRGLLTGVVNRGEVAGVVTLVAQHGRVIAIDSAGVQRLDGPAMGRTTIFRIASMTKPVTSVAAMILVERGMLRLSDTLAHFIPEFSGVTVLADSGGRAASVPAHRPITIRHLLMHRSGISYRFIARGPLGAAYRDADIADGLADDGRSLAENVRRIATAPLATQPGDGFTYGLSTDVLGRVVEIVSGMSLADFMRQEIFAPLGMHDTGFLLEGADTARLASAYTGAPGHLSPLARIQRFGTLTLGGEGYYGSPTYFSGGGGLASTVVDYAKFVQMLVNGGALDGTSILSPASVRLMTTNGFDEQGKPFGPGLGFGLGFGVVTDPGLAGTLQSKGTFWWSGIYGTEFWGDPETGLVGILMLQQFPNSQLTVGERFRQIVYGSLRADGARH